MFKVLCVTNGSLCMDLHAQIEKLANAKADAIILREKDLSESDYMVLSEYANGICKKSGTQLILHTHIKIAKSLGLAVHLPLCVAERLTEEDKKGLVFGASCHSIEDTIKAQKIGCSYIIIGHIFETDCKRGLLGRGVDFLHRVYLNSDIPVYAIGGINADNIWLVANAGAKGACVMSGAMTCTNPTQYLDELKNNLQNK